MFTWISNVILQGGLLGVFLLMTAENIFPPLPSELIMPMAGFVAASGALSPTGVVLVGTLGSAIGAACWYLIGRSIGLDRLEAWSSRHGRWLTLSPTEISRAAAWFNHWGTVVVLVGRMRPGVRGVICIPAGMARMRFGPFIAASTFGSLMWCILLTGAGYTLRSKYTAVEHFPNPMTDIFLWLCMLIYGYRVITYKNPLA
jgi:membrane protein DedA with SNARE-associated domain